MSPSVIEQLKGLFGDAGIIDRNRRQRSFVRSERVVSNRKRIEGTLSLRMSAIHFE